MSPAEHKATIDALASRLRVLQAALAYRAPRQPPPGVPFETFAREVLNDRRAAE